MTLDSRIMEMVRLAKAKYDDADGLETEQCSEDYIACEDFEAASHKDLASRPSEAGLHPPSDIHSAARDERRARYVHLMNQEMDELDRLALTIDMAISWDEAPAVADRLRALAWTIDSLFELDLADAMRAKPRVRVPARMSDGNVIPFPGHWRKNRLDEPWI